MNEDLENLVKQEELTEIATLDDGGGYDWAQMTVWYSEEERRFFWLSDSGCSCNYFGMNVYGLNSLENGSKEDALNALKRFIDGENRYSLNIRADNYLRAKEAIKDVKVPA